MTPILEVKGLSHIYDEGTTFARKALDDLDFSVARGEFIGQGSGTNRPFCKPEGHTSMHYAFKRSFCHFKLALHQYGGQCKQEQ